MYSLRSFLSGEPYVTQNVSVRGLMRRYSVATSVKDLLTYRHLPSGYSVIRTASSVQLINQTGVVEVELHEPQEQSAISDEQVEEITTGILNSLLDFFTGNWEQIKSGQVNGEAIGAAVYRTAATVIFAVVAPPALAIPIIGDEFDSAIAWTAEQVGAYYGSIADDIARLLTDLDETTAAQLMGGLATVWFAYSYVPTFFSGLTAFGGQGWEFTKTVGGIAGDVFNDLVGALEDIFNAAYGVLEDIWNWIF